MVKRSKDVLAKFNGSNTNVQCSSYILSWKFEIKLIENKLFGNVRAYIFIDSFLIK